MNGEVHTLRGDYTRGPTQLPLWRWAEDGSQPTLPASKRRRRVRYAVWLLVLDVACILAAYLGLTWIREGNPFAEAGTSLLSVLMPVYLLAAFNMNSYGAEALLKPRVGIFRAVLALGMAVGLILLAAFFLKASEEFSRIILVGGSVMAGVLLFLTRFFFGRSALRSMDDNPYNEVLIVEGVPGLESNTFQTLDALKCDIVPDMLDPMMLDRAGRLLVDVDRVVVACRPERRSLWAALLKGLNVQGELLAPELDEIGSVGLSRFGPSPTITVSVGPLDLRSRAMKRGLDLAVSIVLLAFLAPLMLLIAVAIRLESKGPIFFAQRRLGRGNRLFMMLKFRSMFASSCDPDGNLSTAREDQRVTRVGKFIRATSLDELPQLLNVLRGDMSLVGPRPHALGSLAGELLFWEVDQRYWHRHCCKPGITGLAQVRGFRGATDHLDDLKNRLASDLEYLAGWTIWRDVAILLRTIRVLIHRNAY